MSQSSAGLTGFVRLQLILCLLGQANCFPELEMELLHLLIKELLMWHTIVLVLANSIPSLQCTTHFLGSVSWVCGMNSQSLATDDDRHKQA